MFSSLVPFASLPPAVQKLQNDDISFFELAPNQYFLLNDSPYSEGSFVIKIADDCISLGFADLDDFSEDSNSILDQILNSTCEVKPGDRLDYAKYKVDPDLLEEASKNDCDIISKLIRLFEVTNIRPNKLLRIICTLQQTYSINTILSTFSELKRNQILDIVRASNPIAFFRENFDQIAQLSDDYSDGNILNE